MIQIGDTKGRGRAFMLIRDEAVSGICGTEFIAHGYELSDGRAEVIFLGRWHSETIHRKGMEGVKAVHCHSGRTRIVWAGEGSTDPIPFAGGHLVWVPQGGPFLEDCWLWTLNNDNDALHIWDSDIEMEYRPGLVEGDHLCAVPVRGEQLWLRNLVPGREALAVVLKNAPEVWVTRRVPSCGGDPAAVSVPPTAYQKASR